MKRKFNISDYPGKYVMHVTTKEQDEIFRRYLHSIGKKWHSKDSYIEKEYFRIYKSETYHLFNEGMYGDRSYSIADGYIVLEFDNFDWSDFAMKHFTKNDLKNGDVIKRRDGTVQIICLETDTCICSTPNHYDRVSDLGPDLLHVGGNKKGDVIAVRRPKDPDDCCFAAFDLECGQVVYERSEVEEMTLEEVCKALGKEIKIVKEK